ncbi:hypothetical protein Patl1_24881 [Pistacia atlantica]|uniref:Uncharacterized protein n=1 Tax=Pistacia atlantica TaxID=434234 RepID=A0ACC1AZ28_9ROSI|nr:hypothetical protein Patl1_24881 [Pistacia atlantica]
MCSNHAFAPTPWLLDSYFRKLHKLCFTTTSSFRSNGCLILISYVGGKHHLLLGIINPGSEGFQKLFFGQEEIAIPVHSTVLSELIHIDLARLTDMENFIEAASATHPTADVFINFASFRSAAASSMAALKQPTIRVVAIIAEGVPEADTKQLIAYARANNKVVIGPATVGGIQAGAFKIGDTAGTIDNIIQSKLYRPGSVGFVSKSVCYSFLSHSIC